MRLNEYLTQDINNPKYLFHGSPIKLDKLIPKLSHDSNNSQDNIDKAVFLFPSLIKASAYAFKDTIKEISEDLEWNFYIPSNDELPVMTMTNVNIDEDIIGYIYVFKIDKDMIKDNNLLQYKCHKEIIPDDVIEIKYKDFMQYYEVRNDSSYSNKKYR